MRWSISSLIVAFPVFLYLSWTTEREMRDPMKRTSQVRRWLTYLTLFASACALIGDVTTLVYNALGGELTIRFVLKVVTVDRLPAGVRLLPPRSSSGRRGEREVAMSGKRALVGILVIVVAIVVVRAS